jgi:hypothetical protein
MENLKKLTINYYNYALQLACYIFNRTLHSDLTKTPYELFFNSKPPMNNLQIFGQPCTSFIVPEKRSSDFSDRGENCRFLGYAADKDLVMFYLLKKVRLFTKRLWVLTMPFKGNLYPWNLLSI